MLMKSKIKNSCYFNDIEFEIKKCLRRASENIKICVAWINLELYQDILLERIRQGVSIYILCNDDFKNGARIHKVHPDLINCLLSVKNPIARHYMHHKFCIIDDEIIITGSYNWSKAASFHFENIIIVENDFKLVTKYKHEFADLEYLAKLTKDDFLSTPIRKNTSNFILGTISNSRGKYKTRTLQTWNVDYILGSFERLGQIEIEYFDVITEIPDVDDYLDEKQREIELFNIARMRVNNLQKYFDNLYPKVNAIGVGNISNYNEHYEYGEEPDKEIYLTWIDIRFNKVLPSSLCADTDFADLYEEIMHSDY